MDWISKRTTPDPRIFRWGQRSSTVLKLVHGEPHTARAELKTDQEWRDWLQKEQVSDPSTFKNGAVVVLGNRAVEDDDVHNPAIISHLPFSEAAFASIQEKLHAHGSIAKIINRGVAVFTRGAPSMGNPLRPAIVYNCRSSYSWPGDIALSITYFPSSGSTYAIFYGCDAKATKEISGRLLEAHGQDVALQPLLIMGIFAELERKRQFRLFDAAHRNLVQIVSRLNNREPRGASPLDDEVDNSEYSVDPWLSVCHLKNGLENWKEQLTRMVEHADELAAAAEKDSKQLGAGGMDKALVDTMRETNSRVRIRLCEIVCDYNEKIRACNMIMDGTTLATQLAHTRANIEIALQTKEDGSQMRSIALLTMIFLPATFVATLFSMSFFNWQPEGDEVTVSPWLWVYFVVAAGLTFISVGTWYLARLRRRRRRRALLLAEKGEEKV